MKHVYETESGEFSDRREFLMLHLYFNNNSCDIQLYNVLATLSDRL